MVWYRGNRLAWCAAFLFICFAGTISAAEDISHVPKRVSLSEIEVIKPLSFEKGVPWVHVHIDGRGPFRFVVDTGSQAVMVSEELTERLRLEDTGKRYSMRTPGGGVVKDARAVRIENLAIGGAVYGNFAAVVHDFSGFTGMGYVQVDGIIGIDCFTKSVVTIDIGRRQLMIREGRLRESKTFGPRMKLDRRHRTSTDTKYVYSWAGGSEVPTLPVQIKDGSKRSGVYELKLDTGYNQGFCFPGIVTTEPFELIAQEETESVTGGGQRVSRYWQLEGSVHIGEYGQISSPVVEISDDSGRIGTRVLQFLTFSIDRDRRLVKLGE